MRKNKVTVVGAGLCGSLLALRLAQRGYEVSVYEKRPDIRTVDVSSGRSINLALSDRGLKALRLVGLDNKAKDLCIPMYGRQIHDREGNTFSSNYSGRDNEYINSVSRQDLTAMLLDELDTHDNVKVQFNVKSTKVDFENKVVYFKNYQTNEEFSVASDVIFGADGAGSSLRRSYDRENKFLFSYCQDFLTHGYKELEIPANTDGTHKISKDHLHIWPRGDFMLIALPNLDGSFTVTLFLSHKDEEYSFEELNTGEKIKSFFKKEFPDALGIIPDILNEFENNPTGTLGTIKCFPWNYNGNTLLIGDAAHAIVPFYGQGMNASFEDIYVFDEILDKYEGNWEKIFDEYQKIRKKDTDAIGKLAIENYFEMRDHVANPVFKEKRVLEMKLEKTFPKEYFSKYSMVTFDETMGYDQARIKGNAQDKVLMKLVANNEFKTEDLTKVLQKVQEETQEILRENSIAGLKL